MTTMIIARVFSVFSVRKGTEETEKKMREASHALGRAEDEGDKEENDGQGGVDNEAQHDDRAGLARAMDVFVNNLLFDMRTQVREIPFMILCLVHSHVCICSQLMTNPKRDKVSVHLPCSSEVFQATFCSVDIEERTTKKLGLRRFVTFDGPGSTEGLCNCMGHRHLPSMRRFHGQDARSNWSVTHVDSDRPVKFTWSTKKKSNVTPLGTRIEEKEMVLVSCSIHASVLEHEQVRKQMAAEEKKAEEEQVDADNDVFEKLAMYKELARRRSELLRQCERDMEHMKKQCSKDVKRLKREMKKLKDDLKRAAEPTPEEILQDDFAAFGLLRR